MSKKVGKSKTESYQASKTISWIEHVGVLLLGFLVVYGTLSYAGTIASGYHFLDDHELIRMEVAFEHHGVSLGKAIKEWMVGDFHWRFRPIYWVERLFGAYIWGSELLYWNIYTAIKGIITFYCLYFTSRYMKYNRFLSAIVPCIVMLGTQFTPWYRSANQESTGLLFCSLALCLIAMQAYNRMYKAWHYNVPIIISALLCGLVKESFTLFMPVFIALKFWLEYCDVEEVSIGKQRWLACLKSNVVTYTIILMGMLVNVSCILFMVGVDNVSYAGFQEGIPFAVYFYGVKTSLIKYTKWYTIIGVLILLLAVMCYRAVEKKDIKKIIGLALIGGYVMATQLVAHAKSGMWERYMFPYMLGYVFVFVLLSYHFFDKDKVHKVVFICVLMFLIYQNAKFAYQNAQSYADNGKMVNQLLQCVRTKTLETDSIICAFADEELNLATESWMEANDRTQVYTWSGNEWKNLVQIMGTAPTEYSGQNAKALACYEWQINDMLQVMGLASQEQYDLHRFGGYAVIVRR